MTQAEKTANYLESLLLVLKEKTLGKEVSLQEIFLFLSGRARPLLPVLLSIPFCQPIQIPGLSTPFGLMIAFLGLRIAFAKSICLPQWILSKKISEKILQMILEKMIWVNRRWKRPFYPKLTWLTQGRLGHLVHGLAITGLGVFLALPMPIPLSNLMTAWCILLIGLGLLERDGLLILIGYAVGILMLLILLGIVFSLKSCF